MKLLSKVRQWIQYAQKPSHIPPELPPGGPEELPPLQEPPLENPPPIKDFCHH